MGVYKYPKGSSEEGRAAFCLVVSSGRIGGEGHNLKPETLNLNRRKNLVTCKSDSTLAQVGKGGCGVSLCGNIQNPAELSSLLQVTLL